MGISNLVLGIWVYQTMEWFAWVATKQELPIAQFPVQPIEPTACIQYTDTEGRESDLREYRMSP